ncbi:TolC family protein [Arenicella xantha]|uniref:Multidrug efflux system outer membrane protein n=1 Tax=Arenicella xantha TaxID=644221 RepID=A0A395JJH2_9GAMM|nr:TolC family protein [Arenicella xantha]RBP50659.1 multidrug efflux system outer membrane protein [Arenicella xantha]
MNNITRTFFWLGLTLISSGCATIGPQYSTPNTQSLLSDGALISAYQNTNEVLTEWWKVFDDDRLSELVDQALQHNRDLVALSANIQASRANLTLARLDRIPSDQISASSSESRQSAAAVGQSDAFADTDLYSVSFAPQWDLDLFGRLSRQIEISKSNYEGQLMQLRGLQLMVVGEVATQYFQLQSLLSERETLQRNIGLQQDSLRVAEVLLEYGRGIEVDVLNARAQLQSSQAAMPTIEASLSQVEARLAVLTGRAPGALKQQLSTRSTASYIDQSLPIGELAELIRRQPGIQVAERKLASSVSEVGLAVSSMFPQVSLVGSVGYSAQESEQLFEDNALQFAFGPTLSWSLSNLVLGKQRVNAAEHRSNAAFAEYEKSVLVALEDLNAALSNQKAARDRQPLLDSALSDSIESARIAKAQYEFGASPFRDLLDAELKLLQTELASKRGVYDIIIAQIAVFRALGAG